MKHAMFFFLLKYYQKTGKSNDDRAKKKESNINHRERMFLEMGKRV